VQCAGLLPRWPLPVPGCLPLRRVADALRRYPARWAPPGHRLLWAAPLRSALAAAGSAPRLGRRSLQCTAAAPGRVPTARALGRRSAAAADLGAREWVFN